MSSNEAETRLKKYGENVLVERQKRTAIKIVLSQFENWLMVLLIVASMVDFYLGERIDSIVILGIVLLSVFFGFFQEYRAEKILEKLKKYITHKARVRRDGKWVEIEGRWLVPDDVVALRVGDRVPADIQLFEVDNLSIDESVLTGESEAIQKQLKTEKNIAYEGTYVISGIGKGVVMLTGEKTKFGKTAALVDAKPSETDFQKQMKNFSVFLTRIVVILTVFVFGTNALLDKGIFESLLFAVALAVGIAPELLPVIITVTLSHGAMKMARKKVIVKRLIAVEDFGNIDTLCADKTGTLTEGVFKLDSYKSINGDDELILAKALVCSSGFSTGGETANQIDEALWKNEQTKTLTEKIKDYQLLDENEFDFERRTMSVVAKNGSERKLIVKGAMESILELCKLGKDKERLKEKYNRFENEGKRVILLAERNIQKNETTASDEKGLTLLGYLLFVDPLKSSATSSLEQFKRLGIKLKIISGDSVEVVHGVAEATGLFEHVNREVISGEDLNKLSEDTFEKIIFEKSLFARITPEQKQRIVATLNKEGHVVGFLGDGVNDAPALKAADVGIAVNTGAEVAKEAADIVLLEKDLTVLAGGIEEGRKTFGNITKYILNTISANYGNMFTVALTSLFLKFIPLLPKQILLTNFISDVPLLAISTDNVDKSFTKRPRRWEIRTIGKFMLYFGLISSFFDFLLILPLIFVWKVSPELFRTAWFVESALSEMLVTFSIRTQLPFYRSKPGLLLSAFSILSGLLAIILPSLDWGMRWFSFVAVPMHIIFWIGLVLVGDFVGVELMKKSFFREESAVVK